MSEVILVPPEVLMGEAGICSIWAMIAVAYVYQRNQHMNGWQPPSAEAKFAAGAWRFLPDPSQGARFVFSQADLGCQAVQAIVKGLGPPKVIFKCAVGRLVFY
jgi:hypothetical protein